MNMSNGQRSLPVSISSCFNLGEPPLVSSIDCPDQMNIATYGENKVKTHNLENILVFEYSLSKIFYLINNQVPSVGVGWRSITGRLLSSI